MDTPLHECLPPVILPDTRLLVLGSLPGEQSLARRQYYGHPRNHFWPLMEHVLDISLVECPYATKLERLLEKRVGLWDVIGSAARKGSLDQNMRLITPNSLGTMIAQLPDLSAVAFNGAAAAKIGMTQLGLSHVRDELGILALPSSSPANTVGLNAKQEAWRALRAYLG